MTSFSEKQKFTQWWLWALLVAALIIPLAVTLVQYNSGNSTITPYDIAVGCMLPLLIILFFTTIKLHTTVDQTGIHYRFAPIHRKMRDIPWTDVEKAYTRTYSPIKEYGGWGIRSGIAKIGKAYNISGNKGLQLELKNGKKILIGTNRPGEIDQLLKTLVQQKVINSKTIMA